ncbi:uncharacterized protein EI90DRAFT_3143204 [Cantharellus anzutake]|uniref:uncharacterized protein n=1 Tax=Cantharellus anzutake TaxID=1750568 RepID=UPI001908CE53|nr:uncharacterized protein EI90DRAFT_3143204 [Cantharellus anzutake]KAF8343885.1 hypothetical protein EI90DRAFT_3143204 [Cantharellus anzutake]
MTPVAMAIHGLVNGHSQPSQPPRSIRPGVFAPIPTFFTAGTQDLDLETFKIQVVKVAIAGVGIVIAGTMGEAHHLSPSERIALIKAARSALDDASPSLAHVPIIAGTGSGSTKQTIELTHDAYQAGADYAIVIMSGFFAGALASNRNALKRYWSDVAENSPLPLFIYNYPGAAGGIDLESDLIVELAEENPNIIGIKLTCGNVGKLTRIAAETADPVWMKAHPRSIPSPFLVLGGFVDFLLPSVFANAHGAITGLANVAPHAIRTLSDLSFACHPSSPVPTKGEQPDLSRKSIFAEAQRLQGIIANADRTIALAGVAGTKWLLRRQDPGLFPPGSECPRRPLMKLDDEAGERLWMQRDVVALKVEESNAAASAGASCSTTVA